MKILIEILLIFFINSIFCFSIQVYQSFFWIYIFYIEYFI